MSAVSQSERVTQNRVVALVDGELHRREDRLLEPRHKQARFRDVERSLDSFDSMKARRARRSSSEGEPWPERISDVRAGFACNAVTGSYDRRTS